MTSIEATFDGPEGEVFSLSGTLPASAFAALIGDTLEGAVVDVNIEIDADSFHLVKIRFAGQVSPLDDPSVIRGGRAVAVRRVRFYRGPRHRFLRSPWSTEHGPEGCP